MMNMKTEQHENFVRRLQLIQDQTGWNLSEIARRVMVSPQAVQQWAKGDTTPRGERLKRLAAVTGKPEHWFFMPLDANEPSNSLSEISTSSSRDMLDDKEKALLALFNQMPEAEKNRLIVHAKATLQELDLLKDDVLSIIKNIRE
ncbi:helix-turn-helix domain-containing protein [Salmonella enterica subsp. enterica serovar Gaminara]|uniref:helix-turn-helix domain-containing protein n=1 Tax=Salmonella enterica TaxID=28901 RepID=UPI000BA9B2F3|nr:helix-turn-helix domain-containing protein [Salmonella enterica]EBV7378400.1 helix-turn-helix domain-containing protein [Salmonella enterica subsp. enterica serovar Gaminara]EDV1511988.1 helix-turn-helix domain-containing protein [Salmonella enterica subsp. enterica serovar Gaminara]PAP42182.1 transcriptional regulator [Salmonella enterica subsp. enterica serovar Aberdeen]